MFTLFHCGQLVGTTDFAHAGPAPNLRLGKFLPTPYGLTVLPRITGRAIAALELHNEHGRVVTFSSLAISDVKEMMSLARETNDSIEVPEELGDWRFLISATFTPARVPDVPTVMGWPGRPGIRN